MKWLEEIFEIILPERNICFICGCQEDYIRESHICIACHAELKTLSGMLCKKCSKPLDNDSEYCNECIARQKCFDKAIAPFAYQGKVKQLIHDFKYNRKSYLYKLFGDEMVRLLIKNNDIHFDAIIPVPVHRSKLVTRGYNQSELLAGYISFHLGLPMVKLIIRRNKTLPQSQLSDMDRWQNVKGVFQLREQKELLQRVLLVDDIYTTGATMNECALLLKNSGIRHITCITIAR
ncbi:MAG: ComF family protein [Tissierellales bacterium]|nr:ComF family protein [Tissierellales bacterium]MBN2827753.1 ComF family protein [Tissierellales bacterium]